MKIAVLIFFILILLILSALFFWRMMDHRVDRAEKERLLALGSVRPAVFSKVMVEELPEPARRYFCFTIKEGTPLHRVAEISMRGQFSIGSKEAPAYMPMRAEQVLAAPEGFVWKMSCGSMIKRISGSDSANWTRFWLGGIVPVARAGGTKDHNRSGFARYLAEAIFWTPAAVLPGPGIVWDAVDAQTARLTVEHNGMRQSIDVRIDKEGRPVQIGMQRWSNANKDKDYRLQSFGGYMSDFRTFDGFVLPSHVEAGNLIGTDAYFPFFIADVTDIRFL